MCRDKYCFTFSAQIYPPPKRGLSLRSISLDEEVRFLFMPRLGEEAVEVLNSPFSGVKVKLTVLVRTLI